jgi:hypothetical protein
VPGVAVTTNATPPKSPAAMPPPPPVPAKRPSTSARSRSLGSKQTLQVAPPTQELSCGRCYYFTARNCNGYVLGGEAGDACEGCLVS